MKKGDIRRRYSSGVLKEKLYTALLKNTDHHFNRLLLLIILIGYISVSHVFLPLFKTRSFLLFAQWNLFSFQPYTYIYDITWDKRRSFLFRDYRKKAMQSGVEIWLAFYLFHFFRATEIPKRLHEQITNFCKCKTFDLVSLKGSLSDHIIYKKQLKIDSRRHYE